MSLFNKNILSVQNASCGLGALFLLLGLGCAESTERTAFRESHTTASLNILFVSVDDLRPELGCYGSDVAKTPHLDAFAKNAFVFDRAVCAVPVCGASRASLMTGLRPNSERFRTFSARADEDAPNVPTLPAWLKSKGYTTLSNGKSFTRTTILKMDGVKVLGVPSEISGIAKIQKTSRPLRRVFTGLQRSAAFRPPCMPMI